MNILIIGSGGREHAIAWKVLQSPLLAQLYITAQNASIIALQKNPAKKPVTVVSIPENDQVALVNFARKEKIDLVVIGGEAPLAAGLSDIFVKAGIKVFGPSQKAAQIECSKKFAKDFMTRHKIPTARYETFSDFSAAQKYLQHVDHSIVIKATGLAAGKGVFLPNTKEEAESILKQLLIEKILGEAGTEIVIEERLQGEEVSLLAFCDGKTVQMMPPVRDYKRLYENDEGPNTGGMGTYAPAPILTDEQVIDLKNKILQPAIDGLRAEGVPFVGVLYVGLMLTEQGARVLEFNCRFGDPETQVLLPLLETDLVEIMQACVNGTLADCSIKWKEQKAVCTVLAAKGYPQKPQTGDVIHGLDQIENKLFVFHAGTKEKKEEIVTAGGRVLGITALGDTLEEASEASAIAAMTVKFSGKQWRYDIAKPKDSHYAPAGVNITAGNRAVELMKKSVQATYDKNVLAGIGAFGGMYNAALFKTMQEPVLVASTDGIGTKVELAARIDRYDSLGFDIVNHSVNDILVQNARPLFFLDYVASSKLNPEKIAMLVSSMADACRSVNCALLGGETAEMPGVYLPNTFDVAGTIVGVVERAEALPRKNLQPGDLLLGIKSSGPHTNGYSLIRKIFSEVDLNTVFSELNLPLADALLAPHRCYLPVLQKALDHAEKPIKALVHITGGGFLENIPRVLSKNLNAVIHTQHWSVPVLFQLIQKQGSVPHDQMYRVFNMGIGMVMIVSPEKQALLRSLISEEIFSIGELTEGEQRVILQ